MMNGLQLKLGLVLVVVMQCSAIMAQDRTPKIGYLYPAGGAQGTTVRVAVGGQYIRNMKDAVISGEGVTGKVVETIKAFPNLNREQRYLLANFLLNHAETRLKDAGKSDDDIAKIKKKLLKRKPWKYAVVKELELEGETLSKHHLLCDMDDKSLRELWHVQQILFMSYKFKQKNRQLAEAVILEIIIDPDAKPGDRVLRLISPKQGKSSNPFIFQVGRMPEKYEAEPNDAKAYELPWGLPELDSLLTGTPYDLPFVLNGQILPGDVDRFRFKAKKGQKLLVEAEARRLLPYLADAVPGWFQAVITLYDGEGKEVAFADDHLFNPDPVMFYEVPSNGEYELEIRDAIYRGREDFVYRVKVSNAPGAEKEFVKGSVYGDKWSRRAVIPVTLSEDDLIPEDVRALPSAKEKPSNDSIKKAQTVQMPRLINGSISAPGDVDVYKVKADAPMKIAVELYGRRLGSPIDSVIKVTDKTGKVIALNDDYMLKEKHLHIDAQGIITHHADSRLLAELSVKGDYYVHVADVQGAGGSKYGYRLRISEPMPGFMLRSTPSVFMTRKNDCSAMKIYVSRRDGYADPINIEVKGRTNLLEVAGSGIPAGATSGVMTLTTRAKGRGEAIEFELIGTAKVDGKKVTAPVKPAERVMQAFLYEHLVPVSTMTCIVKKEKYGAPVIQRLEKGPLLLSPGGTASLHYDLQWKPKATELDIVIEDGPEGLEIAAKLRHTDKKGIAFDIKAGKDMKPINRNIIVSLWGSRMVTPKPKADGKVRSPVKSRWRIRLFPAIPMRIMLNSQSAIGNR